MMDMDIRQDIYGDKIKQMEDEMTPFGFFSDGTDDDYEVDPDGTIWNRVDW